MSRSTRLKDDEVLYGWKPIAQFLNCAVRTAQRAEKAEGLPILRPDERQKGRVLALKKALLAWMTGGVESVILTDNRLIAFNRKTRILWSHEFPILLRNYNPTELEWRLHIVDLTGKGERGVLLVAQFQSATTPDTLYYFSSEGSLVWELESEPPLRNRDGQPFDRAWVVNHVVVTSNQEGATIWAALANRSGWAGCVLRIAPNGPATVHFANAGHVERISPVRSGANDALIICGENNDFDRAFVALLNTNDPPARSVPGERLVYRFGNAPSGMPPKYILFPRTELIVAREKPYGHADRITQHLDGIIVDVETGGNGGDFRYHFSNDLEPKYVFPSGSHEFTHLSLETRGAITHSWSDCPELKAPLILQTWEPDSGWYEQPIRWRDNPWKEVRR